MEFGKGMMHMLMPIKKNSDDLADERAKSTAIHRHKGLLEITRKRRRSRCEIK